ncbi:MAG TPA: MiaB/RimO family radical SAM methylthiotransferase, partial [Clostridia bacterium]|nr:MiaB/RimO family radical SAM methylthiotransferase [Clostridia bacterium]
CAIPLIRGAMHSVPMPALLDEAKSLLDNGVSELTLIAQDTSSYGCDLYAKPMLLELLNALAKLNGLRFLRVLYTYPDTVTPKLIDCIANDEKICNYLDMPLQHIDDDLLLKMNRRGSRQHVEQVLEHIRTAAPDFILRTTIMVGFPGETDAKFEALLKFLRTYQFDRLGAFAFSQEDGTSAASMPNQIPSEIKTLRLNALMAQQREISLSLNQKRVGSVVQVLFEGMRDGLAIGRSYAEAPEIDGAILFKPLRAHKAGEYLNVKLSLACDYDLIGEELP